MAEGLSFPSDRHPCHGNFQTQLLFLYTHRFSPDLHRLSKNVCREVAEYLLDISVILGIWDRSVCVYDAAIERWSAELQCSKSVQWDQGLTYAWVDACTVCCCGTEVMCSSDFHQDEIKCSVYVLHFTAVRVEVETLPDTRHCRYGAGAIGFEGELYLFGGEFEAIGEGTSLMIAHTSEYFNLHKMQSWRDLPHMTDRHKNFTPCAYQCFIYIPNSHGRNLIEVFSPKGKCFIDEMRITLDGEPGPSLSWLEHSTLVILSFGSLSRVELATGRASSIAMSQTRFSPSSAVISVHGRRLFLDTRSTIREITIGSVLTVFPWSLCQNRYLVRLAGKSIIQYDPALRHWHDPRPLSMNVVHSTVYTMVDCGTLVCCGCGE